MLAKLIQFEEFSLDCDGYELLRDDRPVKLEKIPMELLILLATRNGNLVTRQEIVERLWGKDVFVDTEHGINTAVRKVRVALRDDPEKPRFVQTVTGKGYRFVAAVKNGNGTRVTSEQESLSAATSVPEDVATRGRPVRHVRWSAVGKFAGATTVSLLLVSFLISHYRGRSHLNHPRTLTRLTFDSGLQMGASWSPDGRFIAYSSDRGGKFDIWVQPVSGGDPVQVTHGPSHNWQPDWSPDGKYIAYRSEEDDGGIYVIPALGGAGLARRIAPMGYYPRWSPDGSQLLFRTTQYLGLNRFFVVGLDGGQPHEVLTQFPPTGGTTAVAAAWHPDGKRISVWGPSDRTPDFWTVPLAGGTPVRSEFTPDVEKELQEAGLGGIVEWVPDFNFSWSRSGKAIYCALTFRGAVNLWKMSIDPSTLRITAAERLTTGRGADGGIGLNPDGRRLAFTSESQHISAWLFPFDARRGEVKGEGQAASPDGMAVWRLSLSPDGTKMAFAGDRAGRPELFQKSLLDTYSMPVVADDSPRDGPRWSRDGLHLIYERQSLQGGNQLIDWSAKTRSEEIVSDASDISLGSDWSPNGEGILASRVNPATHRFEIWQLPAAGSPGAKGAGRRVIFDSAYDVFQPNFSPDGRWIAFQAVKDLSTKLETTLFVAPASGGPWVAITDNKDWDDKPRWSPDGKSIYFISGRSGFFNVWGLHFDPSRGKVIGRPFAVTSFSSPAHRMPEHEPSVDLSVTEKNLLLTLEQDSGSIWMLDNLDE